MFFPKTIQQNSYDVNSNKILKTSPCAPKIRYPPPSQDHNKRILIIRIPIKYLKHHNAEFTHNLSKYFNLISRNFFSTQNLKTLQSRRSQNRACDFGGSWYIYITLYIIIQCKIEKVGIFGQKLIRTVRGHKNGPGFVLNINLRNDVTKNKFVCEHDQAK